MLVYSNKVRKYHQINVESSAISAHQMSHHRNSTNLQSLRHNTDASVCTVN